MSATTSRTLRLAAVAAATALGLSACGSSDSGGGESGGVKLVKDGKLTVCTHLSYKPFEFKQGGKVVGMDMDMANLAAKKLGVTVEVVDIDFATITSGAAFKAKKCDMGMGAMTITPERQTAALFSKPYFSATQALAVKKDSGVKDLSGLKGKKMGVQTDTTGQSYAKKNEGANGFTSVVFDSLDTQLAGLQSGRVQGAINDNGPLLDWVKDHPTFAVVKEFNTGESYGFNAKKDDPNAKKLMDVFNGELKKAVDGGDYAKMYKKWFGSEPKVLPKVG